jgi:hypothetical protein
MKKIEYRPDGNLMIIDTGWKEFDNKCDLLCVGNVSSNAMFGWYIRNWWNEGEGCSDYPENKREPGRLFHFDMKPFGNIPLRVSRKTEEMCKESGGKSVILYEFRHRNRYNKKIIHGYCLTDYDYNLVEWWSSSPVWTPNTNKSFRVMQECIKYVCTEESLLKEKAKYG